MTIKQRKRCRTRRRAHAAGVSRAIGRPQPRTVPRAVELSASAAAEVVGQRVALNLLTVAKLQALATSRGVEYRAKDRKADLITKIVAGEAQ